jgi:hypothetical protein
MEYLEHKELLIKYYKGLINSIFKLIPIINGEKYKSREIIYSQDEAFKNYQIYLGNLLVEIHGNCELFFQSDNSIKLISILKGMIQQIQVGENQKVKRLTIECINICKKIIKEIEISEITES